MSATIETRLFLPDDLAAGRRVVLSEAQAHHLRNVLRLAPGALLALFNGRDGAWLARLATLDRRRAEVEALSLLAPQRTEPDLWLVFAPIKRHRLEFLVEKATELGVSRLLPVVTQRTTLPRLNQARLWETAREAAEQCERLGVPEVQAPQSLAVLLQRWPAERRLYLCAESGAAAPLAEALQPGPAAFVTGPEGGFAAHELDALRGFPFVTPVGLGPRILRAETAAVAALATWQAIVGDGAQRPPAARAVAGRSVPSESEQ